MTNDSENMIQTFGKKFGSNGHKAIVFGFLGMVWVVVRTFRMSVAEGCISVVFLSILIIATFFNGTNVVLSIADIKKETPVEEPVESNVVAAVAVESPPDATATTKQYPTALIVDDSSLASDRRSDIYSDPGDEKPSKSRFRRLKNALRFRKKHKGVQSARESSDSKSLTRSSSLVKKVHSPTTHERIIKEEFDKAATCPIMIEDKEPAEIPTLEMNFDLCPEKYSTTMKQPPVSPGIEELKARVADVANPIMVHKYGGEVRCYERFLRARQGNLDKAETMFRDCAKFREERSLDVNDDKFKERIHALEIYKDKWIGHYFRHASLDGSPVQLFQFGNLQPKKLVKEANEEDLAKLYLAWMEMSLSLQNQSNDVKFQSQINPSEGEEYQWKGMIEIYDMKGIGTHSMYLPGLMMLNRVLKLGQGNYPENLRICYIINAPWFFSGGWNVVSKVLDPATVRKIHICKNVPTEKLLGLLPEAMVHQIETGELQQN